jgi:hypothetical protein
MKAIKTGDYVEVVHLNGEKRFVQITSIYGNSIEVYWSALAGIYRIKLYTSSKSSQATKNSIGKLIGAPSWKLVDIESIKRGLAHEM